jgi:hypothetical protein
MTKSEIKIAKGTKVTYRYRVDDVITPLRAISYVDCIHDRVLHVNSTGEDGGRMQHELYLSEEGKTWVRGWTGKVVTAFKRAIVVEERKRKLAKAKVERTRDKEYATKMVKVFMRAAAVVKRAKLPREFRAAAFSAALYPYPWRPLGS